MTMQVYSCIIVEDEPIAAEVLETYIGQTPFLHLKSVCTDAIYAMDLLQREPIDLMFLDIHLPKLKGLDFAKTLRNPPKIIITSAYQEYALQGYELDVLDYLLKPIEFSRYFTAVNKLRGGEKQRQPVPQGNGAGGDAPHLFFNVNKKQFKIYLNDILLIESMREYIKIVSENKTILTKMQIGEVEELLPKNEFVRIHRSFIISKQKIEAVSPSEVEVKGKAIPIGRNYREFVLSQFPFHG
jgi:DNA-binding LytR/AlgR family response regulator